MTNIFFDLDGTLIDSRQRLYNLFQELNPLSKLSFDEYWTLKRNRINQKQMLKKFDFSDNEVTAFKNNWLKKIEEKERLKEDKPFDRTDEVLQKLSLKYDLYIITARQDENLLLEQIKSFNWLDFFKKIITTKQKQSKSHIIKKNCINLSSDDIFITDTGEDILEAKALGIKTIAVTSGFLNANKLQEYKPDLIINNVVELIENSLL